MALKRYDAGGNPRVRGDRQRIRFVHGRLDCLIQGKSSSPRKRVRRSAVLPCPVASELSAAKVASGDRRGVQLRRFEANRLRISWPTCLGIPWSRRSWSLGLLTRQRLTFPHQSLDLLPPHMTVFASFLPRLREILRSSKVTPLTCVPIREQDNRTNRDNKSDKPNYHYPYIMFIVICAIHSRVPRLLRPLRVSVMSRCTLVSASTEASGMGRR